MKKSAWIVYYENNGFEIFHDRKKMQEKLKHLEIARKEDSSMSWLTKSVLEDKISFSNQEEYERELKRFIKRGWNTNIDRQIREMSLLKNKPDESKIHKVNIRKEIESLFKI